MSERIKYIVLSSLRLVLDLIMRLYLMASMRRDQLSPLCNSELRRQQYVIALDRPELDPLYASSYSVPALS